MNRIADALAPLATPISDLIPYPDNPRRGNIEVITDSLRRFGQVRPVLFQRSTRFVVAGNHLLKAALGLGWDTVAAVGLDISDGEAKALVLADNRLADLAFYDNDALLEALRAVSGDSTLAGTGFSREDIAALIAGFAVPEAPYAPPEVPRGFTPTVLREVVLLMSPEQAEEFGTHVAALRTHYKIPSAVAAILHSVLTAAEALPA